MATSQTVATTKRRLDDSDDCELDEFRKPKTEFRKYPPPKIRIGVEAVRDFPPGCGILHDSIQRKPLKKLDNVDSSITNLTLHGKVKTVNSLPFEDTKSYNSGSKLSRKVKFWDPMEQVVHDFPPVSGIITEERNHTNSKNSKSTELGLNKPKVKPYDSTCSKENNVKISKDTNSVESRRREKIREVMIMFDEVYTKLSQENKSKQKGENIAHWIVSMNAANRVKQTLKWMTPEKSLGQIRGVHPGDKFKLRSQLQLTGLHCQQHSGIDYTEINGKKLALSIVDSQRYSNSGLCDVLSYCGEGGGGSVGGGAMFGFSGCNRQVAPDDQKLERGNLALKNSMIEKSPVRVIKKVFGVGKNKCDLFVYDGLYNVEDCTQKRGKEGKMVFMFQLRKIPGQPQVQKKVNGNGGVPGNVGLYKYSTFQMLD